MNDYKNSRQKTYSTDSPFPISRTKIEMYLNCPRCFYLNQKLNIKRPSGPAFSLNSAVDTLLKQEFDIHRTNQTLHPLIAKYGLNLKPALLPQIDEWRKNFTGVRYFHPQTNFVIYGAIDDLWVDNKDMYYVVDYKSTSKMGLINQLDDTKWHDAYRRQMEIYQWLLKHNGLNVSNCGYFVYCNGRKDRKAFDAKLEFDITLIPYDGDDSWVEDKILEIYRVLNSDTIPESAEDCEYCKYRKAAKEIEK